MKKILLLASCVMFSSSVFAAPVTLTTGPAQTKVTKVECDALSADTNTAGQEVKVGLSKENFGALECTATDIGVAVTSPKGKGHVYSTNSGGGALVDTACATVTACAQGDADSAATAALAAASS